MDTSVTSMKCLWPNYFHDKSASQISSIIHISWFFAGFSALRLDDLNSFSSFQQNDIANTQAFMLKLIYFLLLIYPIDKVGLTICSKLAVYIRQLFWKSWWLLNFSQSPDWSELDMTIITNDWLTMSKYTFVGFCSFDFKILPNWTWF
jgi:hypothetical protein